MSTKVFTKFINVRIPSLDSAYDFRYKLRNGEYILDRVDGYYISRPECGLSGRYVEVNDVLTEDCEVKVWASWMKH